MLETVDFYREILDNLYDGIFFVDKEGCITYWNKGATSLTGYKPSDVQGRNYCDIFQPLDKHGNHLCESDTCPIRRVFNISTLTEVEAYICHKEGHLLPISIRIAPVRHVSQQYVVAVEIHSSSSPRYAMRQRLEELQDMAMHDPLTGIANRRFVEINIGARLEELKRYGFDFSVMFIDADHFKHINDTHGHAVGDRILKMISATIANSLRSFDIIGRWGGEEFIVLLINPKPDNLFKLADRLRKLVEKSALTLESAEVLQVTVSIGATEAKSSDTLDSLVDRADKLMFESKRRGRNRVSIELSH
ncbi:MAG: sensor domain-containing diguanylate cyclase [Desulfuromonadaceae bacterium]|nr:sensor domain-containing diguanylate cyclase [Desulfuromonadaceae bacterium]